MSSEAIRVLSGRLASLETAGAKLVLLRLMVEHRRGQDEMRCSVSWLARELGLKRETVREALRVLEDGGLLVRIGNVIVLELGAEEVVEAARGAVDNSEGVAAERPVSDGDGVAAQRPGGWPPTGQKVAAERPPSKKEDKKEARERAPGQDPNRPLDLYPVSLAQRELWNELTRFQDEDKARADFTAIVRTARQVENCGKRADTAAEERELYRFVRTQPEACHQLIERRRARVREHLGSLGVK